MINPAYATKQAFKQMKRNGAMSTASIFSITSMLIILGLFLLIVVNVNMIAESAKNQFDTVEVFLKNDAPDQTGRNMIATLKSMDEVKSAVFVSKDDALLRLKIRWGDNAYLLDGLETNPLQNSVEIKLNEIEYADTVVASLRGNENIDEIKYNKTVVDKLVGITNIVQIVSLVLISILIIVSIVVVSNTIKLTVLAREREIGIMKYVGATNWFIRGPFLAEGIIIGLLSALISVLLISLAYIQIVKEFSQGMFVLFSVGMVPKESLLFNMLIIFAALGVGIGSLGSILSMRRFLDT